MAPALWSQRPLIRQFAVPSQDVGTSCARPKDRLIIYSLYPTYSACPFTVRRVKRWWDDTDFCHSLTSNHDRKVHRNSHSRAILQWVGPFLWSSRNIVTPSLVRPLKLLVCLPTEESRMILDLLFDIRQDHFWVIYQNENKAFDVLTIEISLAWGMLVRKFFHNDAKY